MISATAPVEAASESELVERLIELVHEVLQSSLRELHPTLTKEGITMGQFWSIHTVSSLREASLSTVARYLGVSAPTVCTTIDQLEESGLVRRQRSKRDRRTVELSLTPRGRKVEARVWSEISRVMLEAGQGLSTDDVAASVRLFREITRRLESRRTARKEES